MWTLSLPANHGIMPFTNKTGTICALILWPAPELRIARLACTRVKTHKTAGGLRHGSAVRFPHPPQLLLHPVNSGATFPASQHSPLLPVFPPIRQTETPPKATSC